MCFDGFAVAVGKALWVKKILPFVAMLHLEHKVRKKNYLLVFLLPFVVVHYGIFALLPVFGNDADGFFVVDDGRVGRYFPLFKQEFGNRNGARFLLVGCLCRRLSSPCEYGSAFRVLHGW